MYQGWRRRFGRSGSWIVRGSDYARGDATTQPSADTQAATGSVTGTVMMDGKPVANARVGLIDASQIKAHNGKRNKNQTGADATQTRANPGSDTPQAQGQARTSHANRHRDDRQRWQVHHE